MLSKATDVYVGEVDDAVEALSSWMEPIIVVLGTPIGGMVIRDISPHFQDGPSGLKNREE
jgi:type IV pilus assembly protein PilC